MNLLQSFIHNINSKNLFSSKDQLIIAVSGGLDSVVLCHLCREAGYSFSIAHCNFQLRGEESERDEAFVKELAAEMQAAFIQNRFDTETYAKEHKISVQEAARDLRYGWFGELVGSRERVLLLMAHHVDDSVEWTFMNFCRGTGLDGLTGIQEINGFVRRPLLEFPKDELVAYANERQLHYVEDSSNASTKYTRNLFRNKVIPGIAKVYPAVRSNIADNIRRFREIRGLYQFAVEEVKKKICKKKGEEIHIPLRQLLQFNSRALVYEIIHPFHFSEKQVDEVFKLAEAQSGRYLENESFRIIRHRHWLIIAPRKASIAETVVLEENDSAVTFAGGRLTVEKIKLGPKGLPDEGKNIPEIAFLNAKEVQFPLLLRKWKAGDYFYPLGMPKKKKLARFLIDQKLSKTAKEKIWVLESNQRIVWVPGYRIDDRFKLTAFTSQVIRLTIEWNKVL